MVTLQRGSIFNSDAELLVCPVNCVGIMGAGLAKQFRLKFDWLNDAYVKLCDMSVVKLGRPAIVNNIVLFPTKEHWKWRSKYGDIGDGLGYLAEHLLLDKYESIAFPKIGCGLGGLDWETVEKAIVHFDDYINAHPFDMKTEIWLGE